VFDGVMPDASQAVTTGAQMSRVRAVQGARGSKAGRVDFVTSW
jgi:hypothetical protein